MEIKYKITGANGFLGLYLQNRVKIDEKNPDIIIHLAAKSDIPYCNRNREECFDSNINYLIKTLEWASRNNVKGVVVASTDKVYGNIIDPKGADENHPLNGLGIYESSKIAADIITRSYSKYVPTAVIRCGNFIGRGDMHTSRIIPSIINAYKTNTKLILRGDGTMVRDFINVEDACEAYRLVSEALFNNPEKYSGSAWNCSMDEPISVNDIIALAERITGVKLDVVRGTEKTEIQRIHLNSDKIKNLLGWKLGYNPGQGMYRSMYYTLPSIQEIYASS